MPRLTHESRRALSRAWLFLEKAKACTADSRVDYEAFLEAALIFARAELHRVEKQHGKHPGFSTWWKNLLNDPAATFFRTQRNYLLKRASLEIHQRVFAASINLSGAHTPAYQPHLADEFYYFETSATPATETVERHLRSLQNTIAQAESLFASGTAGQRP